MWRRALAETKTTLTSTGGWSKLTYAAAAALFLKNVGLFIEIGSGNIEKVGPAVLVILVMSGLLIVALLLQKLTPPSRSLPEDWESLQPGDDDVVKSPKESSYLYNRFVSGRVSLVGGASGSGKTTMLKSEIVNYPGWFVYLDSYEAPGRGIATRLLEEISDLSESERADLNRFVTGTMQRSPRQLRVVTQEMERVSDLVRRIAERRQLYVILDQFEPELARITSNRLNRDRLCMYYQFFQNVVDKVRLAIIVRKEWLCDAIQFLETLKVPFQTVIVPQVEHYAPNSVIIPSGTGHGYSTGDEILESESDTISSESDTLGNWARRFQQSGVDEHLSFEIVSELAFRSNGFLQIEARIAFITVHSLYKNTFVEQEYREKGVDGIVQTFFERVLGAAPSENIATKILVALASEGSSSTTARSSLDIARLVHESQDQVSQNLAFLHEKGLIARGSYTEYGEGSSSIKGGYVLRHDYVSEFVRNSPAVRIHSSDRDNIRTFAEDVAKGRSWKSFILYIPAVELTLSRVFISAYVCTAIFSIALTFLYPDWFTKGSEDAFRAVSAATTLTEQIKLYLIYTAFGWQPVWHKLDASTFGLYQSVITISIFITQMLFLVYIDNFNRGFFHVVGKRGIVEEDKLRRSNNLQMIVVGAALSSIYTIFAQPYFLFWPALCGIMMGVVQYVIGNERGLSDESKEFIGILGKKVVMNMVACALLATSFLLVAGYLSAFVLTTPEIALATYLAFATFMTLFVLQIWKMHTSGDALSRRRAYYDRQERLT
jgi:hypothetical protein